MSKSNEAEVWRVETNFPREPKFRVCTPTFPGSQALRTIFETDNEEEAHLIATAREMHEALVLAEEVYRAGILNSSAVQLGDVVALRRAALAKAATRLEASEPEQ